MRDQEIDRTSTQAHRGRQRGRMTADGNREKKHEAEVKSKTWNDEESTTTTAGTKTPHWSQRQGKGTASSTACRFPALSGYEFFGGQSDEAATRTKKKHLTTGITPAATLAPAVNASNKQDISRVLTQRNEKEFTPFAVGF